jgi:hypothetical protein
MLNSKLASKTPFARHRLAWEGKSKMDLKLGSSEVVVGRTDMAQDGDHKRGSCGHGKEASESIKGNG